MTKSEEQYSLSSRPWVNHLSSFLVGIRVYCFTEWSQQLFKDFMLVRINIPLISFCYGLEMTNSYVGPWVPEYSCCVDSLRSSWAEIQCVLVCESHSKQPMKQTPWSNPLDAPAKISRHAMSLLACATKSRHVTWQPIHGLTFIGSFLYVAPIQRRFRFFWKHYV